MKHLLLTTTLCGFALSGTAQAAIFEFNQQGYFGGGVFSGFFEGEDTNGDGQIVSFDGEVTDIEATFEGVSFDGDSIFETFDAGSLLANPFGGLVYSLDGLGTIGDDARGAIEGMALNNGSVSIAVGPGPFNLCDGQQTCGSLTAGEALIDGPGPEIESDADDFLLGFELSTTQEVINVTSGPLGEPFGTPGRPFLPDNEFAEEEGFVFILDEGDISPFETFFIDPDIAVGYTYEITGATFASVTAPTLAQVPDADAMYTLTAGAFSTTIGAGDTFTFDAGGVSEFTLTDIDVTPGLDPLDPTAFITGVSVTTFTGSLTITQTPIVEEMQMTSPVPLPAGILMLAPGLALLGGFGRRRRKA